MYLPSHFGVTEPEALHELMRAHPLGALITCGELGLDANHLPFEFDAGEGEHGVFGGRGGAPPTPTARGDG
ncbi:FMN-binding negative transcriptional regulator, partial [Aeromonas encheleia]